MVERQAQHEGSIGSVPERGAPEEVDLGIVGSGGAGLMAALTAARKGARVLVVESLPLVGGATGISAGAAWIPAHGFSTEALGINDDLNDARRYMYGEGRDEILDHDLIETVLQTGPRVARFVEEQTSFGWIPAIWPDYRSDIDGASVGRALFPGPYNPEGLGAAAKYVRPELTTGMAKNPMPFWTLGGLDSADVWIAGPALVGALLEACLANGVEVRVEAAATRLLTESGEVRGLVVSHADGESTFPTRNGVLLASGGFETSDELTREHLDAPLGTQVSPKEHKGIAVQLSEEVGAQLTSMSHAWWMPGVQLPGETLDGRPLSRLLLGERSLPHSIVVNSAGKRFANEALPYDQFGRAMREVDPQTGKMPNDPAWFVFDHRFWEKFGLFGVPPGGVVPDYIYQADTIAGLAAAIGVDAVGLLHAVDGFNPEAARGHDPWFRRGDTLFDRYFGDFHPWLGSLSPDAKLPTLTARARSAIATAIGPVVTKAAAGVAKKNDPEKVRSAVVSPLAMIMRRVLKSPRSSTLGPLNTAPYYAVKVQSSALGTVGGPKTDANGRVLNTDGAIIPGLFAAGNAGGAPTQGFYGGRRKHYCARPRIWLPRR